MCSWFSSKGKDRGMPSISWCDSCRGTRAWVSMRTGASGSVLGVLQSLTFFFSLRHLHLRKARVLHPFWCRCHGSYASQNSQAGANIFHCVCFHMCWYSPFCAECPAARWGCQDTLPPSVFVPFQPGGGSARRLDLSPSLPPSLQSLFGFSGHSRRVSLRHPCVILAITDISLPA